MRLQQKWIRAFHKGSYRITVNSRVSLYKAIYLESLLSYEILMHLKNRQSRILDFGAGGGKYTVPIAYRGYHVDALDLSRHVLDSLMDFKDEVERVSGKKLKIKTIHGDLMDLESARYDFIFSVGVMEHFLDDALRSRIIRKQASLLKKGGVIMTIVPSGVQPMRQLFRKKKLAGYNIPEIDYSREILMKDFSRHGLKVERIYGYNLFGHLVYAPAGTIRGLFNKLAHLFFRVTSFLYSDEMKYQYSYDLICIARKI